MAIPKAAITLRFEVRTPNRKSETKVKLSKIEINKPDRQFVSILHPLV